MINDINGNDLVDAPVRPIPWPDFRKEVLETHYTPPCCAPATRRGMVYMFNFLDTLTVEEQDPETGERTARPAVATTADMTVRLVGRIVTERTARNESPRTTVGFLRCFSAASTIAVQSGYLTRSPFAVKPIKRWLRAGKPTGRRHLSKLEIATLLGHLKRAVAAAAPGWLQWKARRLWAMVAVAVYCGLRRGELEYLEVSDVALDGRIIHIRPKKAHRLKTGASEAPVPMPRALVPIVREWLEHRLDPPVWEPDVERPWLWPGSKGRSPWVGGGPGMRNLDALQAAAKAAGIEGRITWQMLRRSLATHLRSFGVPGAMAAQVLRHSEAVDELFYNESDEDNLRDAVADVEF
jgi:integrase